MTDPVEQVKAIRAEQKREFILASNPTGQRRWLLEHTDYGINVFTPRDQPAGRSERVEVVEAPADRLASPTQEQADEHQWEEEAVWATVVIDPESMEPTEIADVKFLEELSYTGISLERLFIRPGLPSPAPEQGQEDRLQLEAKLIAAYARIEDLEAASPPPAPDDCPDCGSPAFCGGPCSAHAASPPASPSERERERLVLWTCSRCERVERMHDGDERPECCGKHVSLGERAEQEHEPTAMLAVPYVREAQS